MSRKNRTQQIQQQTTFRSNIEHNPNSSGGTVRECMNKTCPRYKVPVIRLSQGQHSEDIYKCSACDGWLRIAVHGIADFEQPPIIDGGRELPGFVGGMSRQVIEQMQGERHLPDYYQRQGRVVHIAPPDDTFHCTPDVKGCPVVGEVKDVVNVPLEMWNQWIFLAKEMSTEWIAYLKGTVSGENGKMVYDITEMYFPKQTMQSATCEAEEGEIQEGTIGSIHSHVGMKAFFSTVDEMHFNHPVEMVINKYGDVECRTRIKLECGRYQRVNAKVMLIECNKELDLLNKLKEQKVTKQSPWWRGDDKPPQLQTQQPMTQAELAAEQDKDDTLFGWTDGGYYD